MKASNENVSANARRRRRRNLLLLAALMVLAYLPPLLGLISGAWPFHDDALTLFNVWRQLGRDAANTGVVPLWNPYVFCGLPLAANNQTAYFYPPNILYVVLPMACALLFDAILHNIWLAWGGYFLGRALKMSRSAAFLTALALGLGGAVSAHIYNGHLTWHAARAWMPWELCALLWYLRTGKKHYAVAFACCLVAQIASGYLPIMVLSLALCLALLAAWALTHRSPRLPHGWLGAAALSSVLCCALSAAFMLPMVETSGLSVHGDGLTYNAATAFSGSWRSLVRLLLPGFFGNNGGVQWSILYLPHEEAGAIGVLPLLLALGAPFFARRAGYKLHPAIWFLYALLPFAVFMAMGKNLPFYRYAFEYLPMVKKTRVPVRWMELFYYASAILCGFSFDALIRRRSAGEKMERRFAGFLGGACAVCVGLLIIVALSSPDSQFWRTRVPLDAQPLKVIEINSAARGRDAAELQNAALLESLLGAAFLGGALYIFMKWRTASGAAARRRCLVFMLTLVALDLLGLFWRSAKILPPQFKRKHFSWPEKLTARYQKEERWDTMLESGIVNLASLHSVSVVNGYDALGQKHYFEFAGAVDGESHWRALYEVSNRSPLLRVAGLTHTISGDEKIPKVRPQFAWYQPRLLAREDEFHLWQWSGAWPRAYVTRNLHRAPEKDQLKLLEKLAIGDFEAQNKPAVVAPGAFSALENLPPSPNDSVRNWNYAWNRVSFDVSALAPSAMVFSDAYYPGWRAYVNGREASIQPTNFLFRGVQVPGGVSRVEMVYEPQTFRIALFITLCGLSTLGAMLTSTKIRSKRRPKSATPS